MHLWKCKVIHLFCCVPGGLLPARGHPLLCKQACDRCAALNAFVLLHLLYRLQKLLQEFFGHVYCRSDIEVRRMPRSSTSRPHASYINSTQSVTRRFCCLYHHTLDTEKGSQDVKSVSICRCRSVKEQILDPSPNILYQSEYYHCRTHQSLI